MVDWSSYTLSDFLLFSPRVYERLFILHNQDLWPAQVVSLLLGIAMLALLVRRPMTSARPIFALLGIAWLVVSLSFFLGRYQQINWLGTYIAALAGIQGAVLIAVGLRKTTRAISPSKNKVSYVIGLGVLACGLVLYPLFELALGKTLKGVQTFGLTPDPTAVATLGALAHLNNRVRIFATIIPAAWCMFAALTLLVLKRDDFIIAPALLTLSLIAIGWPRKEQVLQLNGKSQ